MIYTRNRYIINEAGFICRNDVSVTKKMINELYGYKSDDIELQIKNVIFNNPATIVLWKDGTKTVVKCSESDTFDPEKGLVMAIAKKLLGNKGNYYNELRKWLPAEKEN